MENQTRGVAAKVARKFRTRRGFATTLVDTRGEFVTTSSRKYNPMPGVTIEVTSSEVVPPISTEDTTPPIKLKWWRPEKFRQPSVIDKPSPVRRLSNYYKHGLQNSELTVMKSVEAADFRNILQLYSFAVGVFEDSRLAEDWLLTPNPTLGNQVPVMLAQTEAGCEKVKGILVRIAHGVFS